MNTAKLPKNKNKTNSKKNILKTFLNYEPKKKVKLLYYKI